MYSSIAPALEKAFFAVPIGRCSVGDEVVVAGAGGAGWATQVQRGPMRYVWFSFFIFAFFFKM